VYGGERRGEGREREREREKERENARGKVGGRRKRAPARISRARSRD